MKYLSLVLAGLAMSCSCYAQRDRLVMRFSDGSTYQPVRGVNVIDKSGRFLAKSDSNGYITIQFSELSTYGYFVAICEGYKPDTIRELQSQIFLRPLSAVLNETVVRSSKTRLLLHENNEYVVDYQFCGEKTIVATYSGNGGGKAKLFLLNSGGDILATCKLPGEPLSIFRSCVGNYYCVFRDHFYLIDLLPRGIGLSTRYSIDLFPGLQECEQYADGNFYYRMADRSNFKTTYGVMLKGDSVFRQITGFEEKDVAKASAEEWEEIKMLMATATADNGNMSKAARMQFARLKWDKGSFAHINMPLLLSRDTLIIFDFFRKKMLCYNLQGMPLRTEDICFEWRQSQQFEIIKDEAAEMFYIHRYGEPAKQTIEELNLSTGTVVPVKTLIAKPFAELVRVHNGDVYFLWQDTHSHGTKQLYIQQEALPGKPVVRKTYFQGE